MRVRAWAATGVVALALVASAACGPSSDTGTGTSAGPAPTSGTVATAGPGPTTTPAPAPGATLTCDEVRNATVGSHDAKYQDFYDEIPLVNGVWSSGGGKTVTLGVCATGDLDGDGAPDALAAITFEDGGTGRFVSVGSWKGVSGDPSYRGGLDLGDRTPVESITIAGGQATVVYLTRQAGEPSAAVTTRRTAILALSGGALTEVSHTDAAYTP